MINGITIDVLTWEEWRGVLQPDNALLPDLAEAIRSGLIQASGRTYVRTLRGQKLYDDLVAFTKQLSQAQRRELPNAEGFDGSKSKLVQQIVLPKLAQLGLLQEGIPSEWEARDYSITAKGYAVLTLLMKRNRP